MSQPWVVRATLRAVDQLPGYPNLTVLDLSCGEGEVLENLHRAGCRCRGTHYRDNDYVIRQPHEVLSKVPVDHGVDLHRPLPYPDGSFDVVIMSEVLEHLATHLTVVGEVGRVLKPGGYFLFTSPNIHRVHSRWRFFLSGTHKLVQRRVGWDLQRDDLYAYHTNPVDLPLMHTLLFHSGLRIERLGFTKVKLRHAYWLLLYPFFWLSTRIAFRGRRKDPAAFRNGERDLFRWMVHPAALSSEQLLVVARRQTRTSHQRYDPPEAREEREKPRGQLSPSQHGSPFGG